MSDNIIFVETDKMDELLEIVMRQTDYSKEKAQLELCKHNYNHILVIKEYLGITDKKVQPKSTNQEIYTQLRYKLNSALDEYNSRNENDKKIKN